MSPLLWDAEIAAFDMETTGLSPRLGDRVIEVAVVRGRFGAPPQVWSSLVDPGRPVAATHIHGITDAMVRGQPAFTHVLPGFASTCDGAVPIAHNAAFDLGFLKMECVRMREAPPIHAALDTLGLARRVFGLPSNALDALCHHFDVRRARAHRAADDALATWELAWKMFAAIDPDRRLTVAGAEALCRRRTPEESRALRRTLQDALARGVPIEVEYCSGDRPGETRTRRTITLRQVRTDRLVAWCHLRDAERTFRLDRLRLAEVGPSDTFEDGG